MATAKVFKSGNSQAVRIPREFRITEDELEIWREGERLVLGPKGRGMDRAIELIRAMSDEMFEGVHEKRLPEDRDGL